MLKKNKVLSKGVSWTSVLLETLYYKTVLGSHQGKLLTACSVLQGPAEGAHTRTQRLPDQAACPLRIGPETLMILITPKVCHLKQFVTPY